VTPGAAIVYTPSTNPVRRPSGAMGCELGFVVGLCVLERCASAAVASANMAVTEATRIAILKFLVSIVSSSLSGVLFNRERRVSKGRHPSLTASTSCGTID
jgi:hypothetical protein